MINRQIILAAILAGVCGIAAGWWLKANFARDACLDAGGKWRYQQQFCEAPRWGEVQL